MKRFSIWMGASTFEATRHAAILICLFGSVSLASINLSSHTGSRAATVRTGISIMDPELQGDSNCTQLAEGEYKVYTDSNGGGVGPFAAGVYNFTESWKLCRLPDGSLEIEGKRDYESPEYEQHSNPFSAHLSSGFRTLSLKEFRTLRWRPDSGPLSCNFLPNELVCTSGAKNSPDDAGMDIAMEHPYGFLWPISAFSLSNITRFALGKKGAGIAVEMVRVDEPSRDNPVRTSVLLGDLQYQGQENIRVAGHRWQADRFELKVALHAPFLIWTSPSGLLLDFAEEDNRRHITERGLKLVQFQQYSDF
jgi:hypothetical protein